jgi:hypothetical protein
MKRIAGAIIVSLIISGCARLPFNGLNPSRTDDFRNKLAIASTALEKGENKEAAKLLKEIISHSSIYDVTDEALFRLALIRLSGDEDVSDHEESRLLLTRLKKEFPRSQWTTLSLPLVDLLDEMDELESEKLRLTNSAKNRELQNIKGLNQSLIRQNRDLQQTIERLKAMDLELERKAR